MEEIFVTNLEELQDLECEYDLEDCGMSGLYNGWHWLQDDESNVAVYFKIEEE